MITKDSRKPPRTGMLTDMSTGTPRQVKVEAKAVLEELQPDCDQKALRRWILHWIGEDGVDYGQVGQLGLFHTIEEIKDEQED